MNERYLKLQRQRPTSLDRETLDFIASGLSLEEMAEVTYTNVDTMKHRVSRMMARIGAKNRGHAVGIAYQQGLLGPAAAADVRQLKATISGLRAKVSELEKQHDQQRLVIVAEERRVVELEAKLERQVGLDLKTLATLSGWAQQGQL